MKVHDRVAVTSRSFSKNEILKNELLAKYQHVQFNDAGLKLEGKSLIDFLKDYHKAIVGLEVFNHDNLSKLPKLRVISRFGVGLDNIDLKALEEYQIKLSCTPGINCTAVAELTLTLMLMLIRHSFLMAYQLKQGNWNKFSGHQLSEKTIGIIGANHVGREVIRLLQPFRCQILIFDIVDLSSFCKKHSLQQVDFDALIRKSDILSLHVPLTPSTRHLINKEVICKMKSSAFLINTSRGEVVDQNALKFALQTKQIAGAALDVFHQEPCLDMELLSLPNFIGTPHIAGNSVESELAMGRAAIAGLEHESCA